MGYVYLLMSTDSDGEKELFKIGVTKGEITKRIKNLSTGNPNKIVEISHYESPNYKEIERWIHSHYSIKKTISKNEWFELSNDDVLNFRKKCEDLDGAIKMLQMENFFYKKKK